jgi:hypothetical protein
MKRDVALGTGVLSRTTSCVAVFERVTVFGGPEAHDSKSPETYTTQVASGGWAARLTVNVR